MRINELLNLGTLLGCVVMSGCLTAGKHVTAEYTRQITVASARAAQTESAVLKVEARLKNLEKTLRQQGKVEAQRLENLDQVNAEISKLRGQLEELNFAVQDLRLLFEQGVLAQEGRQLHDEARLKQIEGFLGISAPPPPEVSVGVTADTPGLVNPDGGEVDQSPDQGLDSFPPDAAGKLELANTHIEAGRQALARVILQKAVEAHSGAPEMAEIRYRIGETWFNEKNWVKAIASFEAVNSHHKRSDWAAWAMLRQGECFQEMGQKDNATLFYEEVIRQHPKTDAAKSAKELLK